MAYSAFIYAFVTLLWKSPFIGINWIPYIGTAWNEIFMTPTATTTTSINDDDVDEYAPSPTTTSSIPQYPRRVEDELFWNIVYLFMYGLFGTIAQYCSIMISRARSNSRNNFKSSSGSDNRVDRIALMIYARIYSSYHMVIGIHHFVWCVRWILNFPNYGKLQLYKFNLPGIYVMTSITAIAMIYQAYIIFTKCSTVYAVKLSTTIQEEICYRKSILDTATITTFISFIIFLLCNLGGIVTSYDMNRLLWGLTMYNVPIIVFLGYILQPKTFHNNNDDDDDKKDN